MRHADLYVMAGRLEDAMNRLEKIWMETRELWTDSVSQTVEDEYLVPLHGETRSMLDAISRLAEVMGKAERECSHDRETGPIL